MPCAESGRLRWNAANVSMFYFTLGFLQRMARQAEKGGRYHVARKRIPTFAGPVQVRPFSTVPMYIYIYGYSH